MVKKIIKLVTGLVLIFAVSLGMFRMSNGLNHFNYDTPSENFVGAVSKESYSSKVETAKAFLANELAGATAQPVYMGYQKISNLSSSDIEKLALDGDLIAEVESAESIDVYYTCDDVSKSMNTCLLKIDGKYRYYVSLSDTGEALTNSYFDTVLDGAKYLNCTSTATLNMRAVNDETTTDSTYRQTIMYDNDIFYFDQQLPGMTNKTYFVEDDNSINVYLQHPQRNDGKFYTLAEINRELISQNLRYEVGFEKGGETVWVEDLSTMEDIADFMFMMQLDASYFVKTPYGFSMPNDKYKEVCKLMAGEDMYDEMDQAWDKYHIHFNCDYYVSDGRLSASKTVLTMSNGDDVFALTLIINYTDFGTTKVTLPNSTEE